MRIKNQLIWSPQVASVKYGQVLTASAAVFQGILFIHIHAAKKEKNILAGNQLNSLFIIKELPW